jgi:hypothetical protein
MTTLEKYSLTHNIFVLSYFFKSELLILDLFCFQAIKIHFLFNFSYPMYLFIIRSKINDLNFLKV